MELAFYIIGLTILGAIALVIVAGCLWAVAAIVMSILEEIL